MDFPIVHYCCGSYYHGDFGGVARYDYHISLIFPKRIFFKGPQQKGKLLDFLKDNKKTIVITDNHLACDIPNEYNVVLVHHGCAKTHAIREPGWSPYWKNLCCSGQERMLNVRNPKKTRIISISQFCSDEFLQHYPERYPLFKKVKILHTSELDEKRYKTTWNKIPVILGNWSCENKGRSSVQKMAQLPKSIIQFRQLNVRPNQNGILDFNRRKQDIYLQSDIFLQVSLCEGFSYSALDALLCGIPVVSSNVGLFYNDIPEDCFVKLDWRKNNDTNYVLRKLRYAWDNHEEIGRKGREWYLKNCGFKQWKEKTNKYVFDINE